MGGGPSNERVAVGPWFVEARLDSAALMDGRPYFSLEGSAEFVREKYRRWQGSQEEAEKLALTYGGVAVPMRWVTAEDAPRQAEMRDAGGAASLPRGARPHRCDRTGEEREP